MLVLAPRPASADLPPNHAAPANTTDQAELPHPDVPASTTSLDAEVRLRASIAAHLKDLQAGQDDVRQGVFDRMRLGAALRREALSVYLQLQHNGALGDAPPGEQPLPVGMQQGVVRVDVPDVPGMRLEAGRMALDFGAARMIGRYDFHDTGNAFDGLRLHQTIESYLDLDLLAVKIRRNSAHPDKERNLAGLYVVAKPAESLSTDVYILYLGDSNEQAKAHMTTMGLRLDWRAASWLALEAEAALQVGDVQPAAQAIALDQLAFAVAGTATLDGRRWLPVRLLAHGQIYSGDVAPNDAVNSGWRPLYPSLDQVVGLLQMFHQDNLAQLGARLQIQALATLDFDVDGFLSFSRTGGQLPGFANQVLPGDGGWVVLGPELDLRLRWAWRPWSQVLLAGSVFRPAEAVRTVVGSANAGQLLLQWTSQF